FTFTVRATDNLSQSSSQSYTVVVSAAPVGSAAEPFSLEPTSLLTGQVGVPYTQALVAIGGTAPFHWKMAAESSLPAGLTLDATTGVIRGTPTATGTVSFTVEATDGASQMTLQVY